MSPYGTVFTPKTGMNGWFLMDALEIGYWLIMWAGKNSPTSSYRLTSRALSPTRTSPHGNAPLTSARSCLRPSLPLSTNSLLSPSSKVPPVPSLEYPHVSSPPTLRKCASFSNRDPQLQHRSAPLLLLIPCPLQHTPYLCPSSFRRLPQRQTYRNRQVAYSPAPDAH